ncbi:C-terminal binding protein [Terricaulis silvestris]|uniref:Glycerate dehydrogenase n=1 Tax=Terricaulis silvestris TaxID=2686094 RepID=A0A6I6MJU0_9CAUL|nr:C-terminal binding protein [Terricaulis silvestris]QGZ94939.1 Glycerate dehydrogenase [Terricaulis silvestris]
MRVKDLRKILVTDATFPSFDHEKAVAARHGASFHVCQCKGAEEVAAAAQGVDVLVVQFAQVGADAIAKLNDGAAIVRYGIGLDNIDLKAAQARGVPVAYVPDYATGEVADHTAALILAASRKIIALDQSVRAGRWDPVGVARPMKAYSESVVGFVGFGRIGRGVYARLAPFGFKAVAYDPFADKVELAELGVEAVDLDTVFKRADVLTLHSPLTDETRHVVNAKRLASMKRDAFIVNTARGPLVDPIALADALDQGLIAGAALDVFQTEPLAQDSPLRTCPNLILSPHVAWYSAGSAIRVQELAADEIERHLTGRAARRPAY